MFTTLITIAKAKGTATAMLEFCIKYWRELAMIALVAFFAYKFADHYYEKGRADTNKEWVYKYNAAVKDFNDALKKIKEGSVDAADSVEDRTDKIDGKLDTIEDRLRDLAEKQRREREASGNQCPNEIDLNGSMPTEFNDAWNAMNSAVVEGAKQ